MPRIVRNSAKTNSKTIKVVNERAVKRSQRPSKKKAAVQPGTVLILLGGRFRGRRVVFLKRLGNLMAVTGPFSVNGVPIRRVNPRFCIATSTKVDVSKVDVSGITDDVFKRNKEAEKEALSTRFFAEKPEKNVLDQSRIALRKKVDAQVMASPSFKSEPLLKKYLSARFSLTNDAAPHEMKF